MRHSVKVKTKDNVEREIEVRNFGTLDQAKEHVLKTVFPGSTIVSGETIETSDTPNAVTSQGLPAKDAEAAAKDRVVAATSPKASV